MKVNFQFNDVNRVVITPETEREKQLVKLAFLSEKIRPYVNCEISEEAEITLVLTQPLSHENTKPS